MLLSAKDLSASYGIKPILDQVSFTVEDHQKLGLIGVNGTGKSTLLRILAGLEDYTGTLTRRRGLKIAALWQNPVFTQETLWQEVLAHNALRSAALEEYEMKSILNALKLKDLDQPIRQMSGGIRKRLALAITLMEDADLLLLDEPTNHLDSEMIIWLENRLKSMNRGLIMVTHDRYFLERICNGIVELDQGQLYFHTGSYEAYLENKALRLQTAQLNAHKLERLYQKELEWVRAGVQARSTKQKGRLERFEKLRASRKRIQEDQLVLEAPAARLGRKTISWHNLAGGYDHTLFSGFSYDLKRRDRIGLMGANGAGKTTFLKILAGELAPLQGEVETGSTVKIGIFAQEDEEASLDMKVIDYIEQDAKVSGGLLASSMLERFLFDSGMHHQKLSQLSGGERRRLYLARILMQQPNVLLLDEPTNDLDLVTLEILEDYLDEFKGIVIAVSHDRYFLDRVCDLFFVLENGTWTGHTHALAEDLISAAKSEGESRGEKKKSSWKNRRPGLSTSQKRQLERAAQAVEELPRQIEKLNELMNQNLSFEQLNDLCLQRSQLEEELEAAEAAWLELEELRESMEC